MHSAALPLRRSRLAGEGALEPCANLADAFAGKPAPTGGGTAMGFSPGGGSNRPVAAGPVR
ncbi:hypothetical protein EAG75_24850 [Pseudomonas protegens]|nr:hypothetical protein EAG75_24850 [Pseudomonas protegens]